MCVCCFTAQIKSGESWCGIFLPAFAAQSCGYIPTLLVRWGSAPSFSHIKIERGYENVQELFLTWQLFTTCVCCLSWYRYYVAFPFHFRVMFCLICDMFVLLCCFSFVFCFCLFHHVLFCFEGALDLAWLLG